MDKFIEYKVIDHIAWITLKRNPSNAFSIDFLDDILNSFNLMPMSDDRKKKLDYMWRYEQDLKPQPLPLQYRLNLCGIDPKTIKKKDVVLPQNNFQDYLRSLV